MGKNANSNSTSLFPSMNFANPILPGQGMPSGPGMATPQVMPNIGQMQMPNAGYSPPSAGFGQMNQGNQAGFGQQSPLDMFQSAIKQASAFDPALAASQNFQRNVSQFGNILQNGVGSLIPQTAFPMQQGVFGDMGDRAQGILGQLQGLLHG